MRHKNTVTVLVLIIILISAFATLLGIFSGGGPGPFEFESVRGRMVTIFGTGLYRHMSADVAIQGIAQDYVTLFIGIPVLLISLWGARGGSLKYRFVLAGILGYFFVTYLFYTVMAMFNYLFLAYVVLLSTSFFALATILFSFDLSSLLSVFSGKTPRRFTGGVLIFNALAIALLWLSVVVPPLLEGSIYPEGVEHYTTLIVQGLDLGLLLPLALVSALLFIRGNPLGYLSVPVYFVFLSLLMTALTAKIIAMALNGVNVIPSVFIIPVFNLMAILCAFLLIRSITDQAASSSGHS